MQSTVLIRIGLKHCTGGKLLGCYQVGFSCFVLLVTGDTVLAARQEGVQQDYIFWHLYVKVQLHQNYGSVGVSVWLKAELWWGVQVVPQDHAAKEKALQTMSSMSSAQIVSATAIHNKAAAAGLASLGLASPVSYPGAVSSTPPPLSANHHYPCFKLSHLLS